MTKSQIKWDVCILKIFPSCSLEQWLLLVLRETATLRSEFMVTEGRDTKINLRKGQKNTFKSKLKKKPQNMPGLEIFTELT